MNPGLVVKRCTSHQPRLLFYENDFFQPLRLAKYDATVHPKKPPPTTTASHLNEKMDGSVKSRIPRSTLSDHVGGLFVNIQFLPAIHHRARKLLRDVVPRPFV